MLETRGESPAFDHVRLGTIGQRNVSISALPYGRASRDAGEVRIGVISDTHGLLRPEAEQRLAGVAHIVHAGDIGRPDIIAGLRRIAPVIAIRGNVDTDHWAERYPNTKMVRLGGRSIYVLHEIRPAGREPGAADEAAYQV